MGGLVRLFTGAAPGPVVLQVGSPDQAASVPLGNLFEMQILFFLISGLVQFYYKIRQYKTLCYCSKKMLQDVKYRDMILEQGFFSFFF